LVPTGYAKSRGRSRSLSSQHFRLHVQHSFQRPDHLCQIGQDGGAYDYVVNGNLISGFGLVVWSVHYGLGGVKTFVESGIVYEADLGEKTSGIASKIETFNSNDDWDVVED
jgi:hypothetical protein